MSIQYLAIDAECGLYIRKNGHGNDERFAKLLVDVWRSIPQQDRDAIVDQWSKYSARDDGRLGVSILLENLSKLRRANVVGECAAMGTEIKFYAHVMDLLPDDLAMYVIAHELAHVLQVSRGQKLLPDPHPLGDRVAYMLSPVEKEADQIALAWGFEGSRLNRWLESNVRWDALPKDPY